MTQALDRAEVALEEDDVARGRPPVCDFVHRVLDLA